MTASWIAARFGAAATLAAVPAQAEEFSPNPGRWRPVHYYDLQIPSGDAANFASIRADRIDANNKAYAAKGDRRFTVANAPATEAHFTINFTGKLVVLTVLNTATGCGKSLPFPAANVTVKLCPLRLATFENGMVEISEATGCFLERGAAAAGEDPAASVSYVAYDVPAKSFRLGMIVAHRAVPECSLTIQLRSEAG